MAAKVIRMGIIGYGGMGSTHHKRKEYYENIIAHLNHGNPFIVTHDEVMRVMKVMEAIFQSETENRAMDVCL